MLVSVWFFVFMLVERGLLAPLIVLYLIIRLPQPLALFFACTKKREKKCTCSCAAGGFVKLAKRVSRGVVLVGTFLRKIALVKGAVRVLLSLKTLV